ncbi:MAG: hypothetical protein ABW215_08510 [Kibdelosporangium sp.]
MRRISALVVSVITIAGGISRSGPPGGENPGKPSPAELTPSRTMPTSDPAGIELVTDASAGPGSAMVLAMRRGDVDAASPTGPFGTRARKPVGALSIFNTATAGAPPGNRGAKAAFIAGDPRSAKAFRRALREATADAAGRTGIKPLPIEVAKAGKDIAAMIVKASAD